jgi:hypothetical protein
LTSVRSQGPAGSWLLRFLAAGVFVVGLLAQPGASLAHDGSTGMSISLSAEALPPGGPLEVIGSGFLDGETVEVQLVGADASWPLGTFAADAAGGFAVVLAVPAGVPAGAYDVSAGVASGIIQQAPLVIDPGAAVPAITPTPGELLRPAAVGGVDPIWIVAPLGAIVVAGAGFALFARRFRAAPVASSEHRSAAAPPHEVAGRR